MKLINTLKYIAFCFLLFSCKNKEKVIEKNTLDEAIPVHVKTVGKNDATNPIVASGIIASESEARLSFKTGGIIEKIFVIEGQAVRKGQLLAKLNLAEINANVAQVNEQVNKLERDLARVKNLYKDSVATLEQLQNITTAVNVAHQNQSIAAFNQQYSEIRATTNGKIVKKIMNEGELVGPGMPVFFLVADNANDWVVRVGVSDKDWARLKIGDNASINIDAFKDQVFSGSVKKLAASIDPTSGLYQIELSILRCNKPLISGLFSNVNITPKTKQTSLSIPIEALLEGSNKSAYVYLNDNNVARKVMIKTNGIVQNEVLIIEGLVEGQQIITDGSAYLTDGSKIEIKQ